MNFKSLALAIAFISISTGTFAQDMIYKKNREILKAKILEIGTDEIKFKDFDNPEGPTFSIEKEKVTKVQLQNGDVLQMKTTNALTDPDYYTDQHKNNIKFSFTGLLFKHLDFYYERSLSPTTSFEGGIGLIGIGFDPDDNNYYGEEAKRNPAGVAVHVGYKLKRSPDFYLEKMRYAHLLAGGYIKPEIIFTAYSEDYNVEAYDHTTGQYSVTSDRRSAVSGAFMLNLGKQWIFNDQFSLDTYVGIGYGFTNSDNHPDNINYNSWDYPLTEGVVQYGYLITPAIPLAFTGGISLGYVFGK